MARSQVRAPSSVFTESNAELENHKRLFSKTLSCTWYGRTVIFHRWKFIQAVLQMLGLSPSTGRNPSSKLSAAVPYSLRKPSRQFEEFSSVLFEFQLHFLSTIFSQKLRDVSYRSSVTFPLPRGQSWRIFLLMRPLHPLQNCYKIVSVHALIGNSFPSIPRPIRRENNSSPLSSSTATFP